MKQFVPKKGSILTDEQAQRYGEHIDILTEEHGGSVTPKIIVEDAKHLKSPIHDFFEWEDSDAADKYRLWQARYLMSTIHVMVMVNDDEQDTRAYHNVHIAYEDSVEREYATSARVFSDDELRGQILARAKYEIKAWRERYKQYQELSLVFEAIDTI